MSDCAVTIINQSGHDLALPQERWQRVIDRCVAEEEQPACALTVLLVDRAGSADLHQQHFAVPDATDVMSFPDGTIDPDGGRLLLGDLAVCVDVAIERGLERQDPAATPAARIAAELLLYTIHGLLHLLGFDDHEQSDRAEMWQRQRQLLEAEQVVVEDQS